MLVYVYCWYLIKMYKRNFEDKVNILLNIYMYLERENLVDMFFFVLVF